ncbi:MAG: DUF1634 domain-containing protein [Planctomycetota bacterium]|nr:DUF1634 domain-containing protein [Planctomycetota bacterium]
MTPSSDTVRTPGSKMAVEDLSAWVLRGGLAISITVMLIGIGFSFLHGTISIERMVSDTFDYRPSNIWQGIVKGQGKSIIEVGIYLLVLTPVMRVATSMVLFAISERDWIYVVITLVVLLLTLAGLLWSGS